MAKDYGKASLAGYSRLKGVISISPKVKLDTLDKLSTYYTPGMAAVSKKIQSNTRLLKKYSWTSNNVAVITDGSAILGLGNIGPRAGLPVMEGKALIFKSFAGIDAVPIALDVHSEDEIVAAVKAIAPSFGGIHLEDIAAPLCFRVEDRLKKEIDIPVFHDDQHGTAIVVLAGLINACKITHRTLKDCKVVVIGAGAAGTAIARLIHKFSPQTELLMLDSKGIISRSRGDLNPEKKKLLSFTNKENKSGDLKAALKDSDIFIGVSAPDLLKPEYLKLMKTDPIIFAMANPLPEIMPDEAIKAGAAVIATGRSDFPNQINNALVFPGVFRGALDHNVKEITDEHKIAAAKALASVVKHPTKDKIIPTALEKSVVKAVANAIR